MKVSRKSILLAVKLKDSRFLPHDTAMRYLKAIKNGHYFMIYSFKRSLR